MWANESILIWWTHSHWGGLAVKWLGTSQNEINSSGNPSYAFAFKQISTDQIAETVMKHEAIPEFEKLGINVNITVDNCPWWEACSSQEVNDFDRENISIDRSICGE